MKFKVGQIYFIKNKSLYGKLISCYNRYTFGEIGPSHIGIIAKENEHSVLIYEAVDRGFVSSWYDKGWLELAIADGDVEIGETIIKLKKVIDACDVYVGVPYAWYDIFKIFLFFAFKFKGIYWTGAKKLICSEAVARILYDCSNKQIILGYNPEDEEHEESEYNIPFDLITPIHVYKSKNIKIKKIKQVIKDNRLIL